MKARGKIAQDSPGNKRQSDFFACFFSLSHVSARGVRKIRRKPSLQRRRGAASAGF
jgi:hypothetical protein